jgi:hypothetical protein
MSQSLKLKARVRRAAEQMLRSQAKPVRRLLLATGRDRAPRMPDIVQIESTNICNAKCVFCPRDEMHRRQGIMTVELFRKIVDECVELGITHVRMHNYGEAFIDRRLVEKVRYAKQKGIREVGLISNGSLISEPVARGMIDAGLDAINISVDASGKEVFESTRIGLKYDKHRERKAASETDPVVRSTEQLRRRAGVHRALAVDCRQDSRHRSAQLGGNAEHGIRRQLSLLPSVADVYRVVGRPRVPVLRRLRWKDHPRRPEHPQHRGNLECRALPERPPPAPRKWGTGRLPGV